MVVGIIGPTGMLGHYLVRYLGRPDGLKVKAISRQMLDASADRPSFQALEECDVVINCAGIIKPLVKDVDVVSTIKVNGVFPHLLAGFCASHNKKCIHFTTDCVFSGNTGAYDESSPHDALDVYGKTKSLGEPESCTVIRTSIIGEEVHHTRSLIEWAKSRKRSRVQGYTNHVWNGVTCLQLAKVLEQIARQNLFWTGVRHVFSPNDVTKAELLALLSEIFQLHLDIEPFAPETACNRSLRSIHSLDRFAIPDMARQLRELREFSPRLYS